SQLAIQNSSTPTLQVLPGAFSKLQILAPGEGASPGSATGKTGAPTAQTAGTAFSVTVNGVDTNWNLVTNVTDTVGLTSSDSNASLPANTALAGGAQTLAVTFRTSGTRTVTVTNITDGTKSANTTPSITVNTGVFTKLQLLVPGETAMPGPPDGKTGSPSAQAAGTPFNVTVNTVDVNWNLVNTIADTVGLSSSDTNAILPANAALVAGTKTSSVTLKTAGTPPSGGSTVTASDVSQPSKTPNTSPAITVGGGAPSRLTIQTQPSSAATAGAAFAQQPVVRVEDSSGNLVVTDNGRVITAARGTGSSTLQGSLTATTVNGLAAFTHLSYNVAETLTVTFSATGLTNATSQNIVVSPNTASQLAFTTQPGGVSRTGSPLATQPVIKTQDRYGNVSTVGLSASLNTVLALSSGSGSLLGTTSLDVGTAAGNGTATCTNLQCSDPGTNKQVRASAAGLSNALSAAFNVGGVAPAIGGGAISADTVGATYPTLSGPTYYEAASGDAGTGTIILNAPTGFIFDTTNTPAPTVLITRLAGSGANTSNIDGVASGSAVAITSRTTNQMTLTVTNASSGGVTCS